MGIFDQMNTASGYAKDRPYFHPVVIEKVKAYLNLTEKLPEALDVGCGAGLSSIALLNIADRVTGIDSSASMISSAIKHERIEYNICSAEDLPTGKEYDIITLSGSLNWINRDRFFSIAAKILKSRSMIIIYDNNFSGEMENKSSFSGWYENTLLKKYPRPPRNESKLEKALLEKHGFTLEYEEIYENKIAFSLEKFILYLLTQSNFSNVLKNDVTGRREFIIWLENSLKKFFDTNEKTLLFDGYIWYVRKG